MRINTYSQVWGIKRVFYHIQKLRLPFPVTLPEMLLFTGSEVLFGVVLRHVGIAPVFKYILLPAGLTWLLARLDLEERPPHLFFWSLIAFLGRPKYTTKGFPITPRKKYQFRGVTKIRWDGVDDYTDRPTG